MDGLVDARRAAELLGLTVPALRWHERQGHIEGVRIGRVVRFRLADLRRFTEPVDGAMGGARLDEGSS